jgi:hypothetical protein
MKLRWNGFAVVALLAMLVSIGAPAAYATAELKITDGTNTIDIKDGDATGTCSGAVTGCADANGATNVVTFLGTIGTWTLNVSTGSSHGASAGTNLDLNTTNSTTAASTLTILFSDNGFPDGGGSFTVGGTFQAPAGSSVAFSEFEGAALFDTAAADQLGTTLTFTNSPFAGTNGGPGTGGALTEQAVLTMTGEGSTSFDAALSPVPEPASVALLGGVLLATVSAIRRKARRA